QSLWDLTRMSSEVLRALARRTGVPEREMAPHGAPGVWPLPRPDTYLHAVATEDGLRLDEHPSGLPERPPLAHVLAGEVA
ncbi:MAG TPA: hypothetical protein VKV33_00530, partial [Streptosporangiaceae bacterium]|nr:hypothetical protein [Streptosporangiaceae bacterium]